MASSFYGNNGYSNPYYSQFNIPQNNMNMNMNMQQNTLNTTFVSDIAEVVATKPDVTGKPLFFYNMGTEEIYKKQYDNTGIAPIKTYKLVVEQQIKEQNTVNSFEKSFKTLSDKIDNIAKLLTPEILEEVEKKGRKNL